MQSFSTTARAPIQSDPSSTILAVDLAGTSLPSPELRKTFKFPNAPRGLVPAGQVLPQIIGIEHDSDGLKIAERFIESLPQRIRLGVEFDRWQIIDAEARNILVRPSRSFSAIAATAQRLGHQVVFLERHSFHFSRDQKKQIDLFKQTANQAIAHRASPEALEHIRERLYDISSCFGVGRGCSVFNYNQTSAWRSELMARSIARLGNWKSQDIVLVGTAHALNLATIFDTRITTVIGHYTSQDHLLNRLSAVMRNQVASHSGLEQNRMFHKFFFALRHPLQTWNSKRQASNLAKQTDQTD